MRAEEDKTRSSFDLIHWIEKAICCSLAAALRERQMGIKVRYLLPQEGRTEVGVKWK